MNSPNPLGKALQWFRDMRRIVLRAMDKRAGDAFNIALADPVPCEQFAKDSGQRDFNGGVQIDSPVLGDVHRMTKAGGVASPVSGGRPA